MNNRVCMIVYNYYSWDARVKKEATALARNGYDITVICLRNTGEARGEIVNGVKVRRLPLRSERSGGMLRYAYQYVMFFVMAACAVSTAHIRKRFDVVHTHSLPDFIVFAAAFTKLTGAKVILDLHEAMPEIYLSKMNAKGRGGLMFRLMVAQEKVSMAFADRIVTVSDMVGDIFVGRGLPREKLTVIWNTPDCEKPLAPVSDGGKRLVYAGSMNEYQDFDTVIDGLAELKGVELDIYGEGAQAERLRRKIAEMGLKNVRLNDWVESAEIRRILATYSGAVIPFFDSEITRIALGHKVLEYPLFGLPVISTDLPGIRAVFDDSCFYFYRAGQPDDFARAVKALLSDKAAASQKVLRSQEVIEKKGLTWGQVERRLVDLYRDLVKN